MSDQSTRVPFRGKVTERTYYLIGGTKETHLKAFFGKVRQARRSHTTEADYQSMRTMFDAWKHHTPPSVREQYFKLAEEAEAKLLAGDESQRNNGFYCFIEFFKIRDEFAGGLRRKEYEARRWRNVKANPAAHATAKAAATERKRLSRAKIREQQQSTGGDS
jgi:hypothetical protein